MPGVLRGAARSQHRGGAERDVEGRSWARTEGCQWLEVEELLLTENLARLLHHQEAGGIEGEDLGLLSGRRGQDEGSVLR